MIKLLETNIESKLESFALMKAQNGVGLADLTDGTEIEVSKYVIAKITKDNPKEDDTDITFESIILQTTDGAVFVGRSQNVITLIREIKEMIDDGEIEDIFKTGARFIKTTGQSSNNRKFVQFTLKV